MKKKIILLFFVSFLSVSVFANGINGKYSDGTSSANVNSTEEKVSGTITVNGTAYEISGKLDGTTAYVEVVSSDNHRAASAEISQSGDGIVVRFTGVENGYDIPTRLKLTNE
tara:strand:- start:546 stop:881 length:336 start_codon:yes stop_codon:yes gene_type:complete